MGTVPVVDDTAEIRMLLVATLQQAGHEVVEALDGSDVMRWAREIQPDAIILDLMMPGVDGWEALRQLKAEETTRHIPVIISSALDSDEDLARARSPRPLLEVLDAEHGVTYAARYDAADGAFSWKIAQFLFPIFTLFPATANGVNPGHIWIPMDDHNTMVWDLRWHPFVPLADAGARIDNHPVADQAMAERGPGADAAIDAE